MMPDFCGISSTVSTCANKRSRTPSVAFCICAASEPVVSVPSPRNKTRKVAGIGLACSGVAADGRRAAGLDEKHWLNSCYAQWFNWRHRHKGHAFFRRFHSVLIKTDSQLAETARYILLNPVRARLCKRAEEWPWSSYRAMIGKEPMPAFLSSDWLLTEFGVGLEQARVNFAAFIRAAE